MSTAADGTVVVNLTPGSYVVESDRPVAFQGQAYQWTAFVDVVAGRETTLALTRANAERVPLTAAAPDASAASPAPDPLSRLAKWQASLVSIWSPTARASGFVVDARGLVATARNGIGSATAVEVQVSPTVKVPGRVLVADAMQDVAIVWVDPSVLTAASALPVACPPAAAPSLEDGDEIETITASPRGTGDVLRSEVTGFHPRGIETDLRLSLGETPDQRLAGLRAERHVRRGLVRDAALRRVPLRCARLRAAPGAHQPPRAVVGERGWRTTGVDGGPIAPRGVGHRLLAGRKCCRAPGPVGQRRPGPLDLRDGLGTAQLAHFRQRRRTVTRDRAHRPATSTRAGA